MAKKYISSATDAHLGHFLGQFCLGTTNNVLPDAWTKCSYNFINNQVLFLDFQQIEALVQCIEDADIIKSILQCNKALSFRFTQHDETIGIKIYLQQIPPARFDTKIGSTFKILFHQFFNVDYDKTDANKAKIHGRTNSEIDSLYVQIKRVHVEQESCAIATDVCLQHEDLVPILRPYQVDAVRWMLKREQKLPVDQTLHPLYVKITLESGYVLYFAASTGYVTNEEPLVPSLSTGGILADEMGLGKTVEVLTCILNNPCVEDMDVNSAEVSSSEASDSTDSEYDVPISELVNKRRSKRGQGPSESKRVKTESEVQAVVEKRPGKRVMSANRILTLQWYEKKLQEVTIKRKQPPTFNAPKVQCTCGESGTKDTQRCKKCRKKQHRPCTKYSPDLGPFYCGQCWLNNPYVKSGATLIVSPSSLIRQWEEEIKKHVKTTLRMFVYLGHSTTPIYPTKLQQYDVVLTTYSVLQNELRLVEVHTTPNLRYMFGILHVHLPCIRLP